MKKLHIRQCFNCAHLFDSKVDEDSELCPLCLKETETCFEEADDFPNMLAEVNGVLDEM